MAKRMLADVLYEAANERLRLGASDNHLSTYSCDAVWRGARSVRLRSATFSFLVSLGLPSDARDRCDLFDDFDGFEARQGARCMWLLLAAKVAEDEGIEVDA